MALIAKRTANANPTTNQTIAGGAAATVTPINQQPQIQQPVYTQQPQVQQPVQIQGAQGAQGAPAIQNLNVGVLDNIEGMENSGNYVTMDGGHFLYKSTEATTDSVELIVTYGKRYYQWVDDTDEANKQFYNNDTRLSDKYKLRFEIHWDEEGEEEGEIIECQFHMPTASAMRFIDYVKELAKAGYGIGQIVTRMTISRQQQKKDPTKRYDRAEFTMIGTLNDDGTFNEVANGPTTLNKK